MSATCLHPHDDAAAHPECPGCVFWLRQLEVNRVETEQEIHEAAARGESREAVERRLVERHLAGLTPRGYRRTEHTLERLDTGELVQRWTPAPDLRGASPPTQPLIDLESTLEDYEAERDQPRPGVWAGEPGADLRALTQEETDRLIRTALVMLAAKDERDAVASACGGRGFGVIDLGNGHRDVGGGMRMQAILFAHCQRGGIDSDPLVRILARRAWGDRDRQWFDLRGVRKGEPVALMPRDTPPPYGHGRVATTWPGEAVYGHAVVDAVPGQSVRLTRMTDGADWVSRVSDRLREPPVVPKLQPPVPCWAKKRRER